MKTKKSIILNLSTLALTLTMISCAKELTDPANPYEGEYTLSTQEEVDSFSPKNEANRLIISGKDITDISSLDVKAVGTLVINDTGIENLVMKTPASIATKMEISGNSKLKSISDLAMKFSIGDIFIQDNPILTDISGFLEAKKISGKITITGNSSLGEDKVGESDSYGFNVIKYLISNNIADITKITLSDNHPKAVSDPSLIGQGDSEGGIYSFSIKSDAEAQSLSITGGVVNNLTISGKIFTDAGLTALGAKINTVQGTLTIDGANITTTENFFEKIEFKGDIILKNIESYGTDGTNKFFNTNGFKNFTRINGDLILENIPYLIHWGPGNGFAQIKDVAGNLTINSCGMQQLAFKSLNRVGGNLTITNNCHELYTGFMWNLLTDLTYIGGDFIYKDNDHVNGLGGFEKIEHIGGNLTITGNGTDPSAGGIPYNTGDGKVGFELIQSWIDNGYISPEAVIDCRYADGTEVVFSAPAPDEPESYVIEGRDALLEFAPQDESATKETVKDLTINGNGDQISDHDMSFVKTRVEKVTGNLIIDGISGLTTTEILLKTDGEGFTVDGSIIFRNCPELFNLNAFRFITEVGGDLVFENCPKIATTWGAGQCLSLITNIEGNLLISGVGTDMSGITFNSLNHVGGNFTIQNNNGNFWNFNGMPLESIGGDLCLQDNSNVNGLGGFENLKSVGGNVTISGNGATSGYIPVTSSENQKGLEILGILYDNGVFSQDAIFTIESNGTNYDITEL